MSAPTFPNAALGYRVWKYQGQQLQSLLISLQHWHPGLNKSVCVEADHQGLIEDCECGFYAYHNLARAGEARAKTLAVADAAADGLVIGAVAGSGETQVYSQGFRSQYMQPLALFLDYNKELVIQQLAEAYQIPVFRETEDLVESVAGYAQPTPEWLFS